jgi:hypothetical protein
LIAATWRAAALVRDLAQARDAARWSLRQEGLVASARDGASQTAPLSSVRNPATSSACAASGRVEVFAGGALSKMVAMQRLLSRHQHA